MSRLEQLENQIAELESQRAAEYELERQRELERLAAEKQAEIARRKDAELAAQRSLEEHERQLVEDVEKDRLWWQNLRENCYVPASGAFDELSLCQSFLNGIHNDEAQPSSWCVQCVYGYENPNHSLALGGARRG